MERAAQRLFKISNFLLHRRKKLMVLELRGKINEKMSILGCFWLKKQNWKSSCLPHKHFSQTLCICGKKTISFININWKWKCYRVMKNKPGMSKISNGNICCLYLRLRIYTFSLKTLWSVAKSCEKLLTPEPLQPLLSPPPPQHHQQDEEQHHSHQNAWDRHHHLHPLVAGLLHRVLHRSLHQWRNGAFCKHI